MYSNNFVVAIIVNGKISEETKDGIIAVPFESEYTIRLRNKHSRRAVAVVYIDDENVSEGGIVVNANGYVDFERPVNKAVKFKFVSAKSEAAIDHGKNNRTDGSNGVIRVEWKLEQEYRPHYSPYPSMLKSWGGPGAQSMGSVTPRGGVRGQSMRGEEYCKGGPLLQSYNTPSPMPLVEGCTVEGSYSKQRFTTVHFETEAGAPTIIRLVLKGFEAEKVESTGKLYCDNCGKKLSSKANFCSKCGGKVKC